MKNRLLFLLILAICLSANLANAQKTSKSPATRTLQKSELVPSSYTLFLKSSYPVPFAANNNNSDSLAVSTGYYYVDNMNETAGDPWTVNPEWYSDITTNPTLWTRIQPGPNCVTPDYWTAHPEQGVSYLRNPASASDSTKAAFAGPIPIGFNFFYNGIRYDSFYVSIRGLIGLSNRRYFYDAAGNRTIPSGSTTGAYDPMSDDWFVSSRPHDTTNNYLNSLTDPTPDNFGYYFMACGGTPTTNNTGIRKLPTSTGTAQTTAAGGISAIQAAFGKYPIIAALYAGVSGGSFHLSQYNPMSKTKEDYGRMYYRRSEKGDKLTIYVVNSMPLGTYFVNSAGNPTASFIENNRSNYASNSGTYCSVSYQVTLNRIDSSITMNYDMIGSATVSGNSYTVGTVFQKNCIIGVNGRARARTTDVTAKSPWIYEYSQSTVQIDGDKNNTVVLADGLAIKFKQWKNTGRLVKKEFWARSTNLTDKSLAYNTPITDSKVTDFYELLAGHERLGSVQPVVVIQNMCNNRQGSYGEAVNSTPQNLQMRVLARAQNAATKEYVYYEMMNVDDFTLHLPDDSANNTNVHGNMYAKVRFCDASGAIIDYRNANYVNLNGIKPYGFCKVYFKPFEPLALEQKNIGTMRLTFSIDPRNPKTNDKYDEQWPFDDSLSSSIFVMQKLDGFNDDFSVFNSLDGNAAPSMLKWVNYYSELVDGEQNNYNPLLPRGEFAATNDKDITVKSPCVLMNRKKSAGADHLAQPNDPPDGDELRSFPVDLVAAKNSNLLRTFAPAISVSVQRGDRKTTDGYIGNYTGTFNEGQHIGPEGRVVKYSTPQNYSDIRADGSANNVADRITIQYAMPSPDGIQNITNIATWGRVPTTTLDKTGTVCYAYVLYGGGGKTLGFKEGDREKPVLYNPTTDNSGTPQLGFVPDLFDDGFDYEFKKMVAPIPSSVYNYQAGGGSTFRFMIKVIANRNQNAGMNPIGDDDDNFYIDNVRINMFSGIADLELSSIKVETHYSMVPASQTTAIPIVAYVSNNTLEASPLFVIQGRIYQGGPNPLGNNRFLYCRNISVPFIKGADQQYFSLPSFNARDAAAGSPAAQFVIEGTVFVTGGDQYFENNTNYSLYSYKADSVIAYDAPTATGKNWISDLNITYSGISMPLTDVYNGNFDYFSSIPNRGYAGQIAIKAELFTPDTVMGFRAWFGGYQQGLDQISFRIYNDNNGIPGTMIANSRLVKQRGMGRAQVAAEAPLFNEYIDYYYDDKPVALNAGTYWFAISQDAETCLELGGHLSRLGARVTVMDATYNHERALFIDKTLRTFDKKGQRINYDYVAFQNGTEEGPWVRYMKTDTTWGLWRYDYQGNTSPLQKMTSYMYERTAYAPNLRINFGTRLGSSTSKVYVDCTVPVELSMFDGNVRNKGVDLYWQTESEVDNAGFNIERRELINGSDFSDWKTVKFVEGQGFSAAQTNYSIYDNSVAYSKTYQYRLRQIDKDGTISCEDFSKTVEVTIAGEDDVQLKLTTKNPFDRTIGFSFTIAEKNATCVDVVDLFGNVVKTVVSGDFNAGEYTNYFWDGTNSNGSSVANGSYFLRLSTGTTTKTLKLSLLK